MRANCFVFEKYRLFDSECLKNRSLDALRVFLKFKSEFSSKPIAWKKKLAYLVLSRKARTIALMSRNTAGFRHPTWNTTLLMPLRVFLKFLITVLETNRQKDQLTQSFTKREHQLLRSKKFCSLLEITLSWCAGRFSTFVDQRWSIA